MANSSPPKVSVIVPSYNHARFLKKRLDSVLAQTFQDFEVIVLDDCSPDDSRSLLSQYQNDPRVRIEFNQKNSGSTFKQWNKGVRLARGEYVWIAESDDYADPRLLEELVSRLDADPRAVLSYCRSWIVLADGELSGFLSSYLADLDAHRWTADFCTDGREECRKYLVRRNTVSSASSVLFRRAVYWQIGGADEELVLCGDWKTWASMALTGGTISYVGEPLNYYRSHDASVSEKSLQNGVWAAEALHVTRWILQRVAPTETTRNNVCDDLFGLWYPKVLNNRIAVRRRWAILRDARAIDQHALRKLVYPAFVALRMALARRLRSFQAKL